MIDSLILPEPDIVINREAKVKHCFVQFPEPRRKQHAQSDKCRWQDRPANVVILNWRDWLNPRAEGGELPSRSCCGIAETRL